MRFRGVCVCHTCMSHAFASHIAQVWAGPDSIITILKRDYGDLFKGVKWPTRAPYSFMLRLFQSFIAAFSSSVGAAGSAAKGSGSVPSRMVAESVSFHATHAEKVMNQVVKVMRLPSNIGGRDELPEASSSMPKVIGRQAIAMTGRKARAVMVQTWMRVSANLSRYPEEQ